MASTQSGSGGENGDGSSEDGVWETFIKELPGGKTAAAIGKKGDDYDPYAYDKSTRTDMNTGAVDFDNIQGTNGSGSGSTSQTGTVTVQTSSQPQVTLDQTFDTEVVVDELRSFREDTLSAIETMVDDAFSDLEGEIGDVQDDVDNLEREINGR